MFQWTGGATVESVVEPSGRTEEETVATDECWLTEFKFIERFVRSYEELEFLFRIIDYVLVVFNSMVYTIRTYANTYIHIYTLIIYTYSVAGNEGLERSPFCAASDASGPSDLFLSGLKTTLFDQDCDGSTPE